MAVPQIDIPLPGAVGPGAASDTYPVTHPHWQKGGFRVVGTIAERDAIPEERREEFMVVTVRDDGKDYTLIGGLTNANWVEKQGGGGTSNHAALTNLDYANSGHTGFATAAQGALADTALQDIQAGGSNVIITGSGDTRTIAVTAQPLPDRFTSTETPSGTIGAAVTGLDVSAVTPIGGAGTLEVGDTVIFANNIQGEVTAISGGSYDIVIIAVQTATTWGGIGGTLSNQTDLENRLTAIEDDIPDITPSVDTGNIYELGSDGKPFVPEQLSTVETDGVTIDGDGTIASPIELTAASKASLALADTAYQKPATGIPAVDIAAGVIPDVVTAIATHDTNTNAHGGIKGDLEYVQDLIPSAATPSNQLVDTDTLNSSISNMAANYVTANAAGDIFDNFADLQAGGWYHGGVPYTPTKNDYALFYESNGSVWRAAFDGTQWNATYKINDTPFTSAQLAALNSGITSGLITDINAHFGSGGTSHAAVVADGNAGFMTGIDKAKLDGVAAGATNTPVVNNLTSTSTTSALSAEQGRVLNTTKQNNLVGSGAGQNIRTVNGQNILGAGNISATAEPMVPGRTFTTADILAYPDIQQFFDAEINHRIFVGSVTVQISESYYNYVGVEIYSVHVKGVKFKDWGTLILEFSSVGRVAWSGFYIEDCQQVTVRSLATHTARIAEFINVRGCTNVTISSQAAADPIVGWAIETYNCGYVTLARNSASNTVLSSYVQSVNSFLNMNNVRFESVSLTGGGFNLGANSIIGYLSGMAFVGVRTTTTAMVNNGLESRAFIMLDSTSAAGLNNVVRREP